MPNPPSRSVVKEVTDERYGKISVELPYVEPAAVLVNKAERLFGYRYGKTGRVGQDTDALNGVVSVESSKALQQYGLVCNIFVETWMHDFAGFPDFPVTGQDYRGTEGAEMNWFERHVDWATRKNFDVFDIKNNLEGLPSDVKAGDIIVFERKDSTPKNPKYHENLVSEHPRGGFQLVGARGSASASGISYPTESTKGKGFQTYATVAKSIDNLGQSNIAAVIRPHYQSPSYGPLPGWTPEEIDNGISLCRSWFTTYRPQDPKEKIDHVINDCARVLSMVHDGFVYFADDKAAEGAKSQGKPYLAKGETFWSYMLSQLEELKGPEVKQAALAEANRGPAFFYGYLYTLMLAKVRPQLGQKDQLKTWQSLDPLEQLIWPMKEFNNVWQAETPPTWLGRAVAWAKSKVAGTFGNRTPAEKRQQGSTESSSGGKGTGRRSIEALEQNRIALRQQELIMQAHEQELGRLQGQLAQAAGQLAQATQMRQIERQGRDETQRALERMQQQMREHEKQIDQARELAAQQQRDLQRSQNLLQQAQHRAELDRMQEHARQMGAAPSTQGGTLCVTVRGGGPTFCGPLP